jgi:DNA repair protein NreA
VEPTAANIRKSIEKNWNEYLSKYGNLFSSSSVSGSSPPSVFVGSFGYPKVGVGPMVPPIHGDTSLLDSPERWLGKTLEEIVNFRLNLVRGTQNVSVSNPQGRYIENLQELAMSSNTPDSEITFYKNTTPTTFIDGESAPFGPIGEIKSAKFSGMSASKPVEKAYYDRDLKAEDAVLALYNSGIEISKIQKCFSIGMFGKDRKLVPTRWSITATDDIISKSLVDEILDYSQIDSYLVFTHEHLGNLFSVLLFPHRWIYEMEEAWHTDRGEIGFGVDAEDANGLDHYPSIAGAYFAAKLGIAEYLSKKKRQAGVLVLREIQPEYAVPVGVWQVREAIRAAMSKIPILVDTLDQGLDLACKNMSISKNEWLAKGTTLKMLKQKTITDFF